MKASGAGYLLRTPDRGATWEIVRLADGAIIRTCKGGSHARYMVARNWHAAIVTGLSYRAASRITN